MKDDSLLKAIENFTNEFEANLKELAPVRNYGPQPPKYGHPAYCAGLSAKNCAVATSVIPQTFTCG